MNIKSRNVHGEDLSVLAALAEKEGHPRAEATILAIEIIQQFADQLHHGIEEEFLFIRLAKHGLAPREGPMTAMLVEYNEERRLRQEMKTSSPEFYRTI